MSYIGDFATGEDVIIIFETNDRNGGAVDPSITASNIKIYKDGNDATEISVDADEYTEGFDSLDGINKIVLDVSDHEAFYTAGSDFAVVLSTATIDFQTVRAVLATFSIKNRSEDNAVQDAVNFLKNVVEGDVEIDTTTTPWQLVVHKKGDSETEYIRKDLKDKDGNNITSVNTIIGQHKEP